MAMAVNPDNSDQVELQLAESFKIMAATNAWHFLVERMANYEANSLIRLNNYLASTEHPDREEVITLTIKWHESRQYRRLVLEWVRNYKALLVEPMSEEAAEEARSMLLEYGEM